MEERHQRAFEYMDRARRIDDIRTLVFEFQRFLSDFGVVGFCIGDPTLPRLDKAERVWATTWPEGWADRWVSQNYCGFDPVIHQLHVERFPFRWADLRLRVEGIGARVMDEAQEFRLNDGIAIPATTRSGSVVGITMGVEHYELSPNDEICLHMASVYFEARMEFLRNRDVPKASNQENRLTPREAECLNWVAAGKSDSEIADILMVSDHTAHKHVCTAMKKLNAHTRAQASIIAYADKLISV